jgi:hypothetical protein
MSVERGAVVAAIEAALLEYGPMTRTELAAVVDMPRSSISPVLTRMRKPTKRPAAGKRIHVSGWQEESEGQRKYPRAIYDLGDKDDVPCNIRKNKGQVKRTYDANNYRQAVSSVFDLALNRDDRNAKLRKLNLKVTA